MALFSNGTPFLGYFDVWLVGRPRPFSLESGHRICRLGYALRDELVGRVPQPWDVARRLPQLVPVDAAAQLDTGVLLDGAQPAEQQAQRRGKELRVDLVACKRSS